MKSFLFKVVLELEKLGFCGVHLKIALVAAYAAGLLVYLALTLKMLLVSSLNADLLVS